MHADPLALVVAGPLVHAPALGHLVLLPAAVVAVAASGRIVAVRTPVASITNETCEFIEDAISRLIKEHGAGPDVSVVRLRQHQFIVPGFVDTHIHAPQLAFSGTGYDLTLLQWLERFTFPHEAALSNLPLAVSVAKKVVARTLRSGSTTACYFATIHKEATCALADALHVAGQRAFIGKVCMDRNAPPSYSETASQSIARTLETINYIQSSIASPLVTPIITPRFVPSCSFDLMRSLAQIAQTHNLPIQSHLSETPSELEWVAQLHPEHPSYSEVYDAAGLLTPRAIMAHCVHLSRHERHLLRDRHVGIAHCANSNFSLHSGILNVRQLILEGHTKIGLGTDVAGGYAPGILDAIRQTIIASKVIHMESRERAAHYIRYETRMQRGVLNHPDTVETKSHDKDITDGKVEPNSKDNQSGLDHDEMQSAFSTPMRSIRIKPDVAPLATHESRAASSIANAVALAEAGATASAGIAHVASKPSAHHMNATNNNIDTNVKINPHEHHHLISHSDGNDDTNTRHQHQHPPTIYDPLTYAEAFYLATMGGAKALNLDTTIGTITPGKDFDALIIDVDTPASTIDIFPHDGLDSLFEKFMFLGDDRNIVKVFVRGKLVFSQ